jgi:hypothetical protein
MTLVYIILALMALVYIIPKIPALVGWSIRLGALLFLALGAIGILLLASPGT